MTYLKFTCKILHEILVSLYAFKTQKPYTQTEVQLHKIQNQPANLAEKVILGWYLADHPDPEGCWDGYRAIFSTPRRTHHF